MTGAELVAEIADMLEEDHSLNIVWTEAGLFKYVTQNFPEIARDTGGSDYKDVLTTKGNPSGTTYALTNPETLAHLYEVHYQSVDGSTNLVLPTLDIQESDMLTGVTDPYTTGTPQAVSVEIEHTTSSGVSTYQPVLRVYPGTTTGGTFTAFYKTAPSGTSVLANTVQMREPFRLALKFKCLADALSEDTELHDPERAEVWNSLSQVLIQSLKSLYSGGQLI